MKTRALLAGLAISAAALALLAGAVAFGLVLLRHDQVRFRWAGGIGQGELDTPIGVAYANGRLYVADAGAGRIVVFDTSEAIVARWGDSTLDLGRPMHITRGADGLLYVADYARDRISVLDSAGNLVRRVGADARDDPGALDAPGGAAARGDTVYVADFYHHRVAAFTPRGVFPVGQPGRLGPKRLHYPTDVATDGSLLYVADAYNHRIQVFYPDGRYARRWGGPLGLGVPGPFKGWFHVATGLAVAGGRVYVADFYNDRIQVFTDRGRYLGQVADPLHLPTDVTVAPNGDLYVADFGHRRIVRLEPGNGF